MDKNDDTRQQLILQVLAPQSGMNGADGAALALRSWERLVAHLSPLIGEAGVCALYSRTVRLAIVRHPWLTPSQSTQPIATLLSNLKESLSSIDPATAVQANRDLLDSFTKLLSGLIGEALTTRLLNTAWADEPEGKNK